MQNIIVLVIDLDKYQFRSRSLRDLNQDGGNIWDLNMSVDDWYTLTLYTLLVFLSP